MRSKSYHPLRVFLRYFSIGFWLPDARTGYDRVTYVRTPLGMLHVTWERLQFWDADLELMEWRLVGVSLRLFWTPIRWDYRIDQGSLLFRREREFRLQLGRA